MKTELDVIVNRLRALASCFTGTRLAGHFPGDYHGPMRLVGITFVTEDGVDVDLGDELLEIADALAQLEAPRVVKAPHD